MIFCAAGHDFCGTVQRGTAEHNKHVSLFVASAYLSFVSGMHFFTGGTRVEHSSNISASSL